MHHINASLSIYPKHLFSLGMKRLISQMPHEPFWGKLNTNQVQLCPQNWGVLHEELALELASTYKDTQFRLHANVRVLAERYVFDLADWDSTHPYWKQLSCISKIIQAPAYTAHAGLRKNGSLKSVIEASKAAEELFCCPVGIEGHYPAKQDPYLFSSWEEYRLLYESGANYVIDLSHLNIVAHFYNRREMTLLQEMINCDRCLEIHVSGNDGKRDQHTQLLDLPWWISLLDYANPKAIIFSEAQQ